MTQDGDNVSYERRAASISGRCPLRFSRAVLSSALTAPCPPQGQGDGSFGSLLLGRRCIAAFLSKTLETGKANRWR